MMRKLNCDELHRVGGGYLLDDDDPLFWLSIAGLSPQQCEEIMNTRMVANSVMLFAVFGALSSMAVTECITNATTVIAGSAVFGALVGASTGYSFAKWMANT